MLAAPVHEQNQILSTLLGGSKNVNRIIKDTSAGKKINTHKKKVLFEYLPNLEKIGLVTRSIDEKIHKQRENMELTEIGSELADILDGMEKFYKSHHLLNNKIRQIYIPGDPIKNNSFRSKLRDKGLDEQEIESYNQNSEDARCFEKESLSMCINGLKLRYAFIVSKFTLNSIQQDYLLKNIANMIKQCTLMELESLKSSFYM
jgi:DNA-binding HxlR family transcriptional regulator